MWHLLQRNALNLHGHTLGQLRDGDAAAGRLMREPLGVRLVHLGEVGHVGEEDLYISVSIDISACAHLHHCCSTDLPSSYNRDEKHIQSP